MKDTNNNFLRKIKSLGQLSEGGFFTLSMLLVFTLIFLFLLLFIITCTSTNYTKLKKNKDTYKTINTQKLNLTALEKIFSNFYSSGENISKRFLSRRKWFIKSFTVFYETNWGCNNSKIHTFRKTFITK